MRGGTRKGVGAPTPGSTRMRLSQIWWIRMPTEAISCSRCRATDHADPESDPRGQASS